MARCNSCHAPIYWVEYPSGKKAPLNVLPADDGVVRLDGDGKAHVTTKAERDELDRTVPLFVPHHATCPSVAQHRRVTG